MGEVFFRRTRRPAAEFINDYSEDVSTLFRILQRHYIQFLDVLRFGLSPWHVSHDDVHEALLRIRAVLDGRGVRTTDEPNIEGP